MTDSSEPSAAQGSSSRKRTRTIQNLNDEQLRNKRLVDRKAQRAFRQRSKDCMSSLTALQEVCLQKDLEIEDLRGRNAQLLSHLRALCRCASDAGPLLGEDFELHDTLGISSATWETNDTETGPVDQTAPARPEGHNRAVVTTRAPCQPDVENLPPACVTTPATRATLSDAGMTSPHPVAALSYGGMDDLQRSVPESPSVHGVLHTHSYATSSNPPVAGGYDESSPQDLGPRMSFSNRAVMSAQYESSSPRRATVYSVLPAHSMPTCPLDHILADFRQSCCEQLSQGLPMDIVVGPPGAVVSALLDPEHVAGKPPLSSMLSEVLSTFPHPKQTEKLAFFYLMYQTIRWLVSPAKETYDSMPVWLRPTVTQITIPHAPWIDNIPWPEVRDMLIEQPEDYPFESFSENYSEHVRVNWPFDSHDAVSTVDGNLVLHSIFLKHVRDLSHWTVAPQFLEQYPGMTQTVTVTSHQQE